MKYEGWLVSDSMVKRSLSVVGHYALGCILIYIPFVILGAIIFIASNK